MIWSSEVNNSLAADRSKQILHRSSQGARHAVRIMKEFIAYCHQEVTGCLDDVSELCCLTGRLLQCENFFTLVRNGLGFYIIPIIPQHSLSIDANSCLIIFRKVIYIFCFRILFNPPTFSPHAFLVSPSLSFPLSESKF